MDVGTLQEPSLDDQFYLWLREGIANGSIAVNTNDAYVHLLDDGVLYLNNEIFKRFQEASKTSADVAKSSVEGPEGLERYLGEAQVH